MKNKRLLTVIVCILAYPLLHAQQPGQPSTLHTLVPFLTIAPDSRAGGMGETGVATRPDANSMHWNPAKYAFAEDGAGISLSYIPWLRQYADDVHLSYLAGYYTLDYRQKLAGSIRYFSYGSVDFTDSWGNGLQQYKPREFAADVAYVRKFPEYFSLGLAVRYIRSDLGAGVFDGVTVQPVSAVGADASFYFSSPVIWGGHDAVVSAGVNLSNIGLKIVHAADGASLPTNLGVGVNVDYELDDRNTLGVALDVNKLMAWNNASQGSEAALRRGLTWGVGAAYEYDDLLTGRLGYFYEHPSAGNRRFFTVGAGVVYRSLNFDFAYMVPVSNEHPLGKSLRLSIGYYFY
ncbi:type IX secretion system outer membrane channel protein PorV [Parapedobacter soli]|uniref:type IX secretion system outer membrane channel protein PorV n=1 Tax=Parapedobacter soli TaxID=416955 RepID=UPI0021C89349|nr:type IX secretion system outer membrane channel protein PorV [Parapedobacter soli]